MAQTDLTAADVVRAWREQEREFPTNGTTVDREAIANMVADELFDDYDEGLGLYAALMGERQLQQMRQPHQDLYDRGYALGVEARRLMEEGKETPNADV